MKFRIICIVLSIVTAFLSGCGTPDKLEKNSEESNTDICYSLCTYTNNAYQYISTTYPQLPIESFLCECKLPEKGVIEKSPNTVKVGVSYYRCYTLDRLKKRQSPITVQSISVTLDLKSIVIDCELSDEIDIIIDDSSLWKVCDSLYTSSKSDIENHLQQNFQTPSTCSNSTLVEKYREYMIKHKYTYETEKMNIEIHGPLNRFRHRDLTSFSVPDVYFSKNWKLDLLIFGSGILHYTNLAFANSLEKANGSITFQTDWREKDEIYAAVLRPRAHNVGGWSFYFHVRKNEILEANIDCIVN